MKSLKTIFDQVSLHVFLLLNLSQSVPTRGPKKLGQFVGNLLYMFAYFWKLLLFKQSQPKLWACRTSTIAKTKKPVHSWNPTFLFTNPYIQVILVGKTMSHHNSQTIRDLDIIPRLRARPKYQLSSGTYLLLYLVWLKFLSLSTTFGYAQPWWATLNNSKIGYGPNSIKRKNVSKNCMFWALLKKRKKLICFYNILSSLLGTNLLIFYKQFFWNPWCSILSLFTFKTCYKIVVLTSACLSIGWKPSAIVCIMWYSTCIWRKNVEKV